jgi:nucleotide-binding universal stress UspA family protein
MYPWRRILLPTDFSTAAEWAFDGAIPIAGATAAEIVILHIRLTEKADPKELRFPADESVYGYAEQYELQKLRDHVRRANASLPTRLVVRRAPDPGAEILQTAIEEKTDLLVIATHARHHVAHLLIGSTTLKVITDPPTPILAIRYGTKRRRGLRRIVVPVHLKQTSTAAAELASSIARGEGSDVHLVMVCNDAELAGANEKLAETNERLFGGTATVAAKRGSDIERELVRYCDESGADALFVNARHDMSAIKSDIIRKSGVPVMIVPTTQD